MRSLTQISYTNNINHLRSRTERLFLFIKKLIKNSGFKLDTLHIYLTLLLTYGLRKGAYFSEIALATNTLELDEKNQYILKYFSPVIGLDFVEILGNN